MYSDLEFLYYFGEGNILSLWFISYPYKVHCELSLILECEVYWRYRLLQYGGDNSVHSFFVISWGNSKQGKKRHSSFCLEGINFISAHISLVRMSHMAIEGPFGDCPMSFSLNLGEREIPPLSFLNYEGIKRKMDHCCCSVFQSCQTLCNPIDWSMPGFPVLNHLRSLLKLMSIESAIPSNHLILCHPLLLLPSIFPSIRVFSNESVLCIRCPKYWSFSFSISPSSEYSWLISFRIDWFDLLTVRGTLKSLLLHYSLKASFLRCSAFFIVQFSHLNVTTGKTIALTRWIFVSKVVALLLNMLSR